MLPHSSYSHHRENDPRLEISIELSPDCTTCVATAQQTEAMPSETSSPGANDNDGDDSGNAAAAGATKKRPIIDTTNSNAGNDSTETASPDAKRQKPSVSSGRWQCLDFGQQCYIITGEQNERERHYLQLAQGFA